MVPLQSTMVQKKWTFQDKVESSNVRTQAGTGHEPGYVPKFQTTIEKNFKNIGSIVVYLNIK